MSEAMLQPLAVMRWSDLDETARAQLIDRGTDKIFDPALQEAIGELIEDVRERGDAALIDALKKFDGCEVTPEQLAVSEQEFEQAESAVSEELREALRVGIRNSRAFNEAATAERRWSSETAPGLVVGEKATPVASAGLFVPSGKGSYPSVMVQIGTPAVVAGVRELTVVVPPFPGGDGHVDPAVLCAARELGIRRVFRANGPTGVAAMAFGTETIPRSVKVVGPGSPAVQAAQIQCQRFGTHTQVLLGPSESLILADDSADPDLLAADLLTEAEHGPDSAVLLVTDSQALLDRVQEHVATRIAELPEPRRGWAHLSLGEHGGAVLVADLDEAAEVANRWAPEHMQIVARDEERVLSAIEHAGEVLLGQTTPIAAANFMLGVPAALPTATFPQVTGGITAATFLKRISIAKITSEALRQIASGTEAMAEHEGFPAHAAAIRARAGEPS
ncbi:MAG TPA: histidinol dehydrogenase [Solirubrobacterales bacterium]|nr:histidinol dehydrogenase [Solirubrobacterales bacterium]